MFFFFFQHNNFSHWLQGGLGLRHHLRRLRLLHLDRKRKRRILCKDRAFKPELAHKDRA